MHVEFKKYLDEYEKRITEQVESFFEQAAKKRGQGIDGYLLLELTNNPRELYEAMQHYKKVKKAFNTLFGYFRVQHQRQKDGSRKLKTIVYDKKHWYDNNMKFYAVTKPEAPYKMRVMVDEIKAKENYKPPKIETAHFTTEDIHELAQAVIASDHYRFFEQLHKNIGNKKQTETYTRTIFGKAPKHKKTTK